MRTEKIMIMTFSTLALILAFVQPQETPPPEIRVTGEATVSAEPDRAEIDFGVVTEAATARAAADENAEKLDRVLSAVRDAIGPGGKLETQSYSIQPRYSRQREGGEARITGYMASNVLRATDIPIGDVGKVIDAATAAGANNVQRLQFTVEDEGALKLQALGEAGRDARARAESLAAALDLEIVGVLSVSEGEPVVMRPYAGAAMMQAEARAATPVEPGEVDVRASVTLRVEVRAR